MKILLGNDRFATIDDEDFEKIKDFKWWYRSSKTKRAVKRQEAAQSEINGKTVQMHRFILDAPKGMDVDHINGNQLDNRKENLRLASRSQNLQNSSKYKRRKNCSSKYKGVSFHKQANKWEAGLEVDGKRKWLGLFETEIEAAKAYNQAAMVYFGKFAKLNNIEGT